MSKKPDTADSRPSPAAMFRERLARDIFLTLMGKFATAGMGPRDAERMAGEAFAYADAYMRVANEKGDQ